MKLLLEHINKISSLVRRGTVKKDFPLKALTSIKIGGPARVFVQTSDVVELSSVLLYCKEHKIPLFVLGGGSNILFSDEGFDGVVLKVSDMQYQLEKKKGGALLTLGAGYVVNLAAVKLADEGLSGFEYLYGLPGSVGGAIYMNSKWPKNHYAISDTVESVSYLSETGDVKVYDKEHTKFGYGFSEFQYKKGLVLSATFRLVEKNKSEIKQLCLDVMKYRHDTQPTGVLTAGCVFKNISEEERVRFDLPSRSAGYLIDVTGFKDRKFGGLLVSPVHANFFVNTGTATAHDYAELVDLIKSTVRDKFGVVLREEVMFVENNGIHN
ncbi:MAG: UDP-N-acetylmuramate dehydrogenase [Patescibacteria group bacterium]|jgi:UDP-N-acetylmuramate dehydrogenase